MFKISRLNIFAAAAFALVGAVQLTSSDTVSVDHGSLPTISAKGDLAKGDLAKGDLSKVGDLDKENFLEASRF